MFQRILVLSFIFISLAGYRFGTGDQLEQLPSVLYFFDPSLYQKDFELQMIYPWYLKSGFFISHFLVSKYLHIRPEFIFFISYYFVIFNIFYSLYLILKYLNINKEICFFSLILLMPFAHFYISVSHFKIVVIRLVPYLFAIPLCLYCIYFFLKGHLFLSSILLSFVIFIHPQIWIILSFSLLLSFVYFYIKDSIYIKDFKKKFFTFSLPLFISFLFFNCLLQIKGKHRGYPWFSPDWGQELLKMVKFRVPHHLLLSYSKLFPEISLFLIATITPLIFFYTQSDLRLKKLNFLVFPFCFLIILGYFFTEKYPLPLAFNLYLFRSDVFIRLIFFINFIFLLQRLEIFNTVNIKKFNVFLLSILLMASFVMLFEGNIKIFAPSNDLVSVSKCIKNSTPKDTLVMIPPDIKGVRFYSERSVLANWKTHGLFLSPKIAKEWFHRMLDLCKLEESFSCLGKECKQICKKNYDNFSPEELTFLANKYDVDLILTRKDYPIFGKPICSNNSFFVYSTIHGSKN